MNYVDPILKYLSGELSQDEENSFREDLASKADLKKEFEEVSAAYGFIRDQLVERDELAFKQKLLEAMDREIQPPFIPPSRNRTWWLSLVALAASLAIVWLVFQSPSEEERLISKYYSPDQDPVILAFNQDTRGEQEEGIQYYRNEQYREAMQTLDALISETTDNKVYPLFYLLSALELDKEGEVIELILKLELEQALLPDQAISWYATLALIKLDRLEEARSVLAPLSKETGPYRSDAENLLKHLLK